MGEPSRVVPDRETAVPNPTRTAIGVSHAVFVIERPSHLLKLEVGKDSFPIVRMDALDERLGVFQQALSRPSPDPFICWTDVSNLGNVRVGNPEDLVDVLLDQLESLLTSAEGFFRPFVFRDVAGDGGGAHGLSRRVENGENAQRHENRLTIFVNADGFIVLNPLTSPQLFKDEV